MKRVFSSRYQPAEIEDRIYREWMERGYFHAEPDPAKTPFTVVIPPPNITGELHMGHALNNTLQDILVRMKRMQQYCTLWIPGTDHASIATEARIVSQMRAEGVSKEELGREAFLEKAWEWKRQYGSRIIEQLKRLGSSCDWSRERFTLDENLSRAVTEVFVRLFEKGLIYRGERMINWCPVCSTSISDAEVEYSEKEGNLWHIRYPLRDGNGFVTVATTRPETMLGDTAVAVHPGDARYRDLIGKKAVLPLMGREIPIIADEYVDIAFGTGALKITPGHDPNDFEIGLRHRLDLICVINDNATMSLQAGRFAGMDRYQARKEIIAELERQELIISVKPHRHHVGECYRCSTVIEPKVSLQWFVHMKPLAEPAIRAVQDGQVRFFPERFEKNYFNWMENIRDWCISRQLWWGHRIPAYYCQICKRMTVSRTIPDACPGCGGQMVQDNDTLDTWFSSALWPFSTLGWPEQTVDLDYFYPTDVLVTAYDIIFFWVARMIFSGLEHTGDIPFSKTVFHGLVRDEQGRKMSKSLGNGIDPLEVIGEFGADALRFALVLGSALGNDIRLSPQKIEAGRNFTNKIWNAARFVLMHAAQEEESGKVSSSRYTDADKWILSRANQLTGEVTDNIEKFEFGIALQKIYEFLREEFCDWYIELVKPRLYDPEGSTISEARHVLRNVLTASMKLLHPFMPFITEEIYQSLHGEEESIMVSCWPGPDESPEYQKVQDSMGFVMDSIRTIRNIRADMEVPPGRKAQAVFVTGDPEKAALLEASFPYFEKLASVSGITVVGQETDIPDHAATAVLEGAILYLSLSEFIDPEKEVKRLSGERRKLVQEIQRAENRLSNEQFLQKAPEGLVREEKEKYARLRQMMAEVEKQLNGLTGSGKKEG